MYQADLRQRLIVPEFIRKIAQKIIRERKTGQKRVFISELDGGLIDYEKWEVEKDEEFLQF